MHATLNFFDPNRDIPAHHENQLTRAFLVVLKMSPAAHQAWLSLAAPGRRLYELPRPWTFDTQRRQMFHLQSGAGESIEGISVLLSADTPVVDGPVQFTDRAQVLDGIVNYGDQVLVVIETKLDGVVSSRQAVELNVHGANVRFEAAVRTVSWRQLLAAWSDLVESDVVAGAERTILVDFLDFVERYFPRLGPYTTLARCGGQEFRVNRRLNAVLTEIGGDATRHWLELAGRATLDRAFLYFDTHSQRIRLDLYPADTLTQAKAFYTRPGSVSGLLSLRDAGWEINPNFHFGFMAAGFVWTAVDAPVEEYAAYWCELISSTATIMREDWEQWWLTLVQRHFARPEEKAQFDDAFTNTSRPSATPRPGLKCTYSWALSEATRLDTDGQFVTAVQDKLNEVLRTLGEGPLNNKTGKI